MFEEYVTFSNVLPISLGVISVIFLLLSTRRGRNLPPGPRGLPLLGSIREFKSAERSDDFARLRKQYGDVYSLRLGFTDFFVINGTKALSDLIVKQADAMSDRPSFMFTLSKGLGIAGASGDRWREQRSFALKTFRSFGVGKRCLEKQVMEEVTTLMTEMEHFKGSPFDISHLISISVSNIICSIVFGRRYDHDDNRFQYLMTVIQTYNLKRNLILENASKWLRYLPGDFTGVKKSIERQKEIRIFLAEQIREHRESFDKEVIRDYIDAFLLEQESQSSSNSYYSDDQLLETILNFFNAGTETTSTTIRWTIYYLITHPEVQAKMYEEIKLGLGASSCVSMTFRQNLPYCEAVITESLRLANIAPQSIPHGTCHDVTWNGYVIPKGSTVILNLSSVCMDPDLFPEPHIFKPERFLDKDGHFIGQKNFFPFSLGRRICLGESLANMELFLFIVTMVQWFQLLPEKEGVPPQVHVITGITRNPSDFMFRAIKRP
ncbi:hypothetical protein FSP39_002716 [Pinctada imbricata]|uniref:Uncharacterized protein n=1 Tax=Pinctada imbricata TaxID=66713 RepID=A0AA89C692_PINIB|nr:hypothetical protein FSP39_002716 [Pinctada imbricata]